MQRVLVTSVKIQRFQIEAALLKELFLPYALPPSLPWQIKHCHAYINVEKWRPWVKTDEGWNSQEIRNQNDFQTNCKNHLITLISKFVVMFLPERQPRLVIRMK